LAFLLNGPLEMMLNLLLINVAPRLDIPRIYSKIMLFKSIEEEMTIMRTVMNNSQAARLRDSGGVLLPWSQCAYR
jgi:hypothetical protein